MRCTSNFSQRKYKWNEMKAKNEWLTGKIYLQLISQMTARKKCSKDQKKIIYSKRNTIAIKCKKKFLISFIMRKMKSKLYWDAIFLHPGISQILKVGKHTLMALSLVKETFFNIPDGRGKMVRHLWRANWLCHSKSQMFPFDPEIPVLENYSDNCIWLWLHRSV